MVLTSSPDMRATGLQRSSRANKGEGGALRQLMNISNTIHKLPVAPKLNVTDIPASQQTNPMAPVNTKPTRCHLKQQPKVVFFLLISPLLAC